MIWHGSLCPQLSGEIIDWNFESILGFFLSFVETCAHTLFSPNVIIHCIEPVRLYNVKCTVQTNKLLWLSSVVSCLFKTVQLIIILAKTLTFISTFTRILEVFVPLIILSKSKRNNLFEIVFTCSIAFQRYQTWHGNDYLNLINCQAGQKRDEVLVSLNRRDWSIRWLRRIRRIRIRRRWWWIAICWSRPVQHIYMVYCSVCSIVYNDIVGMMLCVKEWCSLVPNEIRPLKIRGRDSLLWWERW